MQQKQQEEHNHSGDSPALVVLVIQLGIFVMCVASTALRDERTRLSPSSLWSLLRCALFATCGMAVERIPSGCPYQQYVLLRQHGAASSIACVTPSLRMPVESKVISMRALLRRTTLPAFLQPPQGL